MEQDEVHKAAKQNYSASLPWPAHDAWHSATHDAEALIVERWLGKYATGSSLVLNAGSGGTEYNAKCTMVHLDIVENHICKFPRYVVCSIESIDFPDNKLDGIVCVGSVLNYTTAQMSVAEFSRVVKPGGFLILEFERTESAEFLFTSKHGKDIFLHSYLYNDQIHHLWMYSEKYIIRLLKHYGFKVLRRMRIQSLSSVFNRFGLDEKRASNYSKFDRLMQPLSFPISHNVLLLCTKNVVSQGYDGDSACDYRHK